MASHETPLHVAARHGNLQEVASLLKESHEKDLDAVTSDSENTALHYAAALDDSQILHLLLMAGAKPNKPNVDGQRPLSIAVQAGEVANAVILISFGGRLSLEDLQAANPIHYATQQTPDGKRDQMISMLQKRFSLVESRSPSTVLKRNAPSFVKPDGTIDLASGFNWAIRKGNPIAFYYLLDIKLELVNEPGNSLKRPLHRAAELGRSNLVKYLLDNGADVKATTDRGMTPLHYAAEQGHEDTVDLLLEFGADKNAKTRRGHHTPAKKALDAGHEDIAEKLGSGPQSGNKEARRGLMKPSTAAPTDPAGDGNSDGGTEVLGNAEYDGVLMGDPHKKQKKQGITIARLRRTGQNQLHYKTGDKPGKSRGDKSKEDESRIKIAVLDTGIDLQNSSYADGRDSREDNPIKGKKNFATKFQTSGDVSDKIGHGTQVAGLILDIAPNANLYIARICDGNDRGNSSDEGQDNEGPRRQMGVSPQAVVQAIKGIEWAIENKVHIINMSIGFKSEDNSIKSALESANQNNILVFASMNNEGSHEPARWPARDKNLTIGIHGSQPYGVEACLYAGLPVPDNPNFMVRGEEIETRWPGGLFQIAQGSSYAAPIAASMAALILQFTRQKWPKPPARSTSPPDALRIPGKEKLHKREVMVRLLEKVSVKSRDGNFLWIHPQLLWKDAQDQPAGEAGACRAACEVIQTVLRETGNDPTRPSSRSSSRRRQAVRRTPSRRRGP